MKGEVGWSVGKTRENVDGDVTYDWYYFVRDQTRKWDEFKIEG